MIKYSKNDTKIARYSSLYPSKNGKVFLCLVVHKKL